MITPTSSSSFYNGSIIVILGKKRMSMKIGHLSVTVVINIMSNNRVTKKLHSYIFEVFARTVHVHFFARKCNADF